MTHSGPLQADPSMHLGHPITPKHRTHHGGLGKQQSVWSQTANRMKASIGRAVSGRQALVY